MKRHTQVVYAVASAALVLSLCPLPAFGGNAADATELSTMEEVAAGSGEATVPATDGGGDATALATDGDETGGETEGGGDAGVDPEPVAPKPVRTNPVLTCGVKVSGSSWTKACGSVKMGRAGAGKAVTSLSLKVKGGPAGSIAYRVYLKKAASRYGKDGKRVGRGKAKNAVQSITVKLTGNLAKRYNVCYRVYVKGHGWMGWAKNGKRAGVSSDQWRFVQAYQVKLVKKGKSVPKSTKKAYVKAKTKKQLLSIIDKVKSGKKLTTLNSSYKFSSEAGKKLQRAINSFHGGKLGFVMVDLTTGEGVSYNARQSIYSASCLKGPYVAAVCRFRAGSIGGYKGTMSETIRVSCNDCYGRTFSHFGSGVFSQLISDAGNKGKMGTRKYEYLPTYCLNKLWVSTYWYFCKEKNRNSAWCKSLYTSPLNSFIRKAFRGKYTTYSKPGWYPGGGFNVQNDSGIVMANGRPYLITVMSGACGQYGKLANLCRALDVVHSDMC